MILRCLVGAALTLAPMLSGGFVAGAETMTGIPTVRMFDLAGDARAAGRFADAETLYRALAQNPDLEVRSEARFRLGMMLAADKHLREAATVFRALLDEKPDAARVRIELARILAELGDMTAAARELRQARAAGLPPDIARVVDQFATALRSTRPYGFTVEIAVAPDSNINRATEARTLDTVVAPVDLSSDARARSGVGIKLQGQAFVRYPLGARLALLPRISGSGDFYRKTQFQDNSASLQLGLERSGVAGGRATLSLGRSWRWYGGDRYSRGETATIDWLRPIGRVAQIVASTSIGRTNYIINDLQDGMTYAASLGYERAFSARSGGSLTIDGLRQTARDPGYSSAAGGLTGLLFREVGRVTVFGSASLRRLEGDKPLFLFPKARREWFYRFSLGGTFRQATIRGFAPVVRAAYERNRSTVGLYDYRRRSLELGISRAF